MANISSGFDEYALRARVAPTLVVIVIPVVWEHRVICAQNQRLNSHRAGYTLLGACVRGLGARWMLCAEWLLRRISTVGRTGEPWQCWGVRWLLESPSTADACLR
ncbi:MAG: hypothetical protein RLZZ458_2414 [Planctomycetota bacterium]